MEIALLPSTTAVIGTHFLWPAVSGVAGVHVVTIGGGQVTATLEVPIIDNDVFEVTPRTIAVGIDSVTGGALIDAGARTVVMSVLDDGDVSAPGTPSQPTLVRATGGMMELSLDGVDPATTGGASEAIVGRKLYRDMGGGVLQEVGLRVNALSALTTYAFVAVVRNSQFESPPSAPLVVATAAGSLPTAPSGLGVDGTTGGSVAVSWSEPFDVGGVAVVGYVVQVALVVGGLVR